MGRRTKIRAGAIDHQAFTASTLNAADGKITIGSSGTNWELDILTDIAENVTNDGGASVTQLNYDLGNNTYETIIQLTGTPSADTSGDKRLFVFINGVELTANALSDVANQTSQIKITLDYQLNPSTDTIKVWYSA